MAVGIGALGLLVAGLGAVVVARTRREAPEYHPDRPSGQRT